MRLVFQTAPWAAILFFLPWSQPVPEPPSEAVVTFYTHGELTDGIPGTHHDVYVGGVFDGSQYLFRFQDGIVARNNRFLTLRLPAGPHTFGASNGSRPQPRETATYTLAPGEHYFVRIQGESAGVPGVFTIQHGIVEYIPCVEAQVDLLKAKPLKEKAFSKYLLFRKAVMVVEENTPPSCG